MTDYQHLEIVMRRLYWARQYQFSVRGNNESVCGKLAYMYRPILHVDGDMETVATQMCAALGEDA